MEKTLSIHSQNFFDAENDLICITKDFKSIKFISKKWEHLLGWTLEEMNRKPLEDFILPDDWQNTLNVIERASKKHRIFGYEDRWVTRLKDIIWLEWRMFYENEDDPTFIFLAKNITDFKENTHHLKLTQLHAALGSWKYNAVTENFVCSEEFYKICELPIHEKFSYAHISNFFDEENWQKFNAAFINCLEKGIPWNLEMELVTARNNKKWIQSWGFPIKIGTQIVGVEGMSQDLTRKRNEQQVLKQTIEELDKFQLSINQHCLVARLNPEGFFIDINYNFEKTAGYRLVEIVGKNLMELTAYSHHELARDILTLLKSGKKWRGEFKHQAKNGTEFWVDMSLTPIMDMNRHKLHEIVCISYDINQKKLMEISLEEEQQKTIQSSKLATLGELAAGLAHEVNNPLTIIFGYIRVLEEEILSQEDNYELMLKHLGLIKNAAQRAAKIVVNLKDFARDGSSDPFMELPSSQLIAVVLDLCSERFKKHGIHLDVSVISDPMIYCRKIELSQVLLNLLFNSFDALENKEEKWVRLKVEEVNQAIEISVVDSGEGLTAEVAERIFTPFFTTKKVGFGSGIGLSISQRIVLNHGGELYYDRNSTHTKFVIRLPHLNERL